MLSECHCNGYFFLLLLLVKNCMKCGLSGRPQWSGNDRLGHCCGKLWRWGWKNELSVHIHHHHHGSSKSEGGLEGWKKSYKSAPHHNPRLLDWNICHIFTGPALQDFNHHPMCTSDYTSGRQIMAQTLSAVMGCRVLQVRRCQASWQSWWRWRGEGIFASPLNFNRNSVHINPNTLL